MSILPAYYAKNILDSYLKLIEAFEAKSTTTKEKFIRIIFCNISNIIFISIANRAIVFISDHYTKLYIIISKIIFVTLQHRSVHSRIDDLNTAREYEKIKF